MRKLLAIIIAAVGLTAGAAGPESLLHVAIGSPAGVTVLSSSDWAPASDSGVWSNAAKSSNGGRASSTSQLDLQVTGPMYLSFSYRVSSESFDKLKICLDDVEKLVFSGNSTEVTASSDSVAVPAGTHTVSFRYVKDSSTDSGADACWVTGVSLSSEAVLTIPASKTTISSSDYAGKTTFTKVVFAEGSQLTSVANNAFKDCTMLKSITFPEGLTTIGSGVFDGCSSLMEVNLPSTLTSLGTVNSKSLAMFSDIANGYHVMSDWVVGYAGTCPAEIPEQDRLRGFADGALKGNDSLEVFAPKTRKLVTIGQNALENCFALEYFEIPSSVTAINDSAFLGCTMLGEISVPGSVKRIGQYAFRNCFSLAHVALASGVEAIGYAAFLDDYLISEVDIPASVTSLATDAFGGDSSLIRIGVRGDLMSLSKICSNYAHLREVTVKPGDKDLVEDFFAGCTELEDVRFLATAQPGLVSNGSKLFTNTPETLTVYVPAGSTGWCGIAGAPGLPMAWPKGATTRRAIAYWNVPTYLVEFDSNGGSLGVQPTYQRPETPFNLPPQPTQSGYTFAGWWTSPVEGWQVTAETPFLEGVYTKLYAHWTRPHKIFLNANGGTVTNSTVTLVEQTVYGVLPAPFRTGYAFGGWSYGDKTVVPSTEILTDADHTLTAQWTAYRYSVHYLPNGGTGSETAQEFTYDTLQSLDACRFTRTGYTFVGWAKTAAGAVAYTDGQRVKNLTALQGGIVKLYAVWARNYTIVFDKGDGTGVRVSRTFPYGYTTRLPALKNGLHWQRTGFTFKGWATSEANAKAGTVWKADWAQVATAAAAGKSLTVYGVWQVTSPYYGIRYNKYDGSGAYRTQAYKYGDASHLATIRYGLGWARKGFIFRGWATSAANAAAGTVWKADWGQIATGISAGTLKDIYAVWKVDASTSYAIKFMKNDGGSGWRTVGFTYGVSTHLPSCANGLGWSRTGYTFKGWATSAANAAAGKVWKSDYATVATTVAKGQTLTVYAVWQKNGLGCVVAPTGAHGGDSPSASAAVAPRIVDGTLVDGSGEVVLTVRADGRAEIVIGFEDGTVAYAFGSAIGSAGCWLFEAADGTEYMVIEE